MKQRLFQDSGELLVFFAVVLIAFLPLIAVVTVNMIEGF
jgi:hypothetical protein